MIFCEFYIGDQLNRKADNKKRGIILGWAHDGRMYAAVMVSSTEFYEVPLCDMVRIDDIRKKTVRKMKKSSTAGMQRSS